MNKPTKPNITIPESFAANGVKADFDNNKILNGFDRIQPDVLAGDNLNKFIDDTYKASNYALDLGDYADEIDAAKVNKTGDTMTGALKIEMVTPYQYFKNTNIAINDSTATTVAYTSFFDKNSNLFGGISLIHQPTIGNYFSINPRDESGVAMTQPFLVGRGSAGDFCSLPMATTPPSTMSTARPNLISAVVANYHNENSWYMKCSDGFIMQGGYGSGGDTLNGAQLAFATPFLTATYSFQATIFTVTTALTFVRSSNKTTSSINVTTGYLNGSSVVFNPYGFNWLACGY